MHRITLLSTCLFASLTCNACGSVADNTESPDTLAVLHGTLTNPDSVAVQSDVRVAVVWTTYRADEGGVAISYSVAQEVTVQPVFPSQFTLDLVAPPPESALMHGPDDDPSTPADFRMAIGGIVAYEDLNGNGALDLAGPTDTAFVDRVLGASDSVLLAWFQGTLPTDLVDSDGHAPSLGFNLLSMPRTVGDATDDSAYCFGEATPPNNDPFETHFLPVDSSFVLPLTADPKLATWMCESPDGSSSSYSGGYPTSNQTFPQPSDPGLKCSADGRAYYWESCIQAGLCSGTECSSECYSLAPAQATPAGWPCAVR